MSFATTSRFRRLPDLLAKPPRFGVEPRHFRAPQHRSVDGEHASQAAQANPQLVRALRVLQLADYTDIRGDLIQAFAKDIARRLLGDLSRIDCNCLGISGRKRQVDLPLFREKIAAGRLGKPGEPQASVRKQRLRDVEQSARAAFDELDLHFTQLGRTPLGADLADVDRQLRAGAVLKRQLAGGTPDHGLADGLQRRAIHA